MNRHTRLFTLLGIIGLCALLIGCGGGGGGGVNPAGSGSDQQVSALSGVISFDGKPSANTGVYLVRQETALAEGIARLGSLRASTRAEAALDPAVGDFRTMTDDEGRFAFSQVPVGAYNLVAVKDATHQSIKSLVVGEIQTVSVELTPTGNLSGVVNMPGVTDLSTILVYLEGTSYVGVTDSAGSYIMTNLPAGSYTIVAARGNAISAKVPVTVSPAVTNPVQTLELVPQAITDTGTIQGTVSRQVPTPGTYPTVYQSYSPAGTIAHLAGTPHVTVADETGNYQFAGVPQGDYTIVFPSDVFTADTAPTVTVSSGMTSQVPLVTLTLSSSFAPGQGTVAVGSIVGTVRKSSFITPAETHAVGVQLTGTNYRNFIYSDPTGGFVFHQVPLGATYNLQFIAGNYTTASATPISVAPASPSANAGSFRLDPMAVPPGPMPSISTCTVYMSSMTITGANLASVTTVLANGRPLEISATSPTDISVYTYDLMPGEYQITVITSNGMTAYAPDLTIIPFSTMLNFLQTPIPPASYSHVSAQLDWSPVTQADKYHVVRIDGAAETFVAETYGMSFRVSDLLPGTTYTFGVKPVARTGFRGPATTTTFTTKSSVFAIASASSSVSPANFVGIKARENGDAFVLDGTNSRWYGYNCVTLSQYGPSTAIGAGYNMTRFIPGKSGSDYFYGFLHPTSAGPGVINGFSSVSAYGQSPALGSSVSSGNSITQNLVTSHIVTLYSDGSSYYLASLTDDLSLVGSVNIGQSANYINPEIHMNVDGTKVFVATGSGAPFGFIEEYDTSTFAKTRTITVDAAYINDFSASPNNDKFIVLSGEGQPYQMRTFDQNFTQTSFTSLFGLKQAQYDHFGRIWMAVDDGSGASIMVQENGQTYQQPLGLGATFTGIGSMNVRIITFDNWSKRILVATDVLGTLTIFSIDASYLFGG